MSLQLSVGDISALVRATTVLLDPFGYESGDAWQREACAAILAFVGADAASTTMPSPNGTLVGGEPDIVRVLQKVYPAPDWAQLAVTEGRRDRQLVVANWTELFEERRVRRSAFYNDVVVPNRLLAPISMMEEIVPDQFPAAVSIYYCDEKKAADRVEERKLKMQLLLPAFRAGVRAHLAVAGRQRATMRMTEAIPIGVALCDGKGSLIHANRKLSRLLAVDPNSADVVKAINVAAAETVVFACPDPLSALHSAKVAAEIRTPASRYRVSAVLCDEERGNGSVRSIVFVECLGPRCLSASDLAERYSLTPREIQIASCLQQGLRSKEIAQRLGISINTVRRHVERILAKLNIHSRSAVAATISTAAE